MPRNESSPSEKLLYKVIVVESRYNCFTQDSYHEAAQIVRAEVKQI